jgi:glutamate/tyrosine decarboxylase-like PLP-dependent enzyme
MVFVAQRHVLAMFAGPLIIGNLLKLDRFDRIEINEGAGDEFRLRRSDYFDIRPEHGVGASTGSALGTIFGICPAGSTRFTRVGVRIERMRTLLNLAADTAARYLESLDDRGVAPSPDALAGLSQLNEPFPELPIEPECVLEMLDRIGSPATVGMAGRRYFGFVIGGSLPAALAANWLAGAWDQNPGLFVASPIGTVLEEVSLCWLLDVLKLPAGTGGAFVTGATMANFTALAAARHDVLARAGWDVESDGLFGAPPIAVVVGEEAHPSLIKALGMLGLGRSRLVRVPVDRQGRMIPAAMPHLNGPAIVCIQSGNVNTGSFDPADEICARAHASDAWVHVDGAFGLWAAASPKYLHLVEGVASADSWATDAHKWLNVPYDSGLAFVRNAGALKGAMSLTAAYLPQGGHREPSQYTPELSRRARGVEIWAALKSLGRTGLAGIIERNCRFARRFADALQQAGSGILNEVVLNQVLVSFGDANRTRQVIERVQRDGTCWCGPTEWQGHTAMRISVSSWATRDEDVERSLTAIMRAAAR